MSTQLARIEGEGQGPLARFQPQNLEQAMQVADMLSKSGLIPDHLKGKPADVLATILAGAEFGLGMMQSFRAMYLVKGKVGFYSDFIVSKVLQHPECAYFRLVESTHEGATYETQRRASEPVRLSFTLEQAKAAGLLNNPTYRSYPDAMLRARCASALARAVYPDALFGVYSKEEIEEMAAKEKEINPPPQAANPPPAASPQPALGVAAVSKRLQSAGKGKAKEKPMPVKIVDVQPGETEEEAAKKAQSVALKFGPMKGTPLATLSADQLADHLEKAREHLRTDNGGRWTPLLRGQIAALEYELGTRPLGGETDEMSFDHQEETP